MDDEEREACIAHQHVCHSSDNKHHDKVIDGMTVDIGTMCDWSESMHEKERDVAVDGTDWVHEICTRHDSAVKDRARAIDNVVIPTKKMVMNAMSRKCLTNKRVSCTTPLTA